MDYDGKSPLENADYHDLTCDYLTSEAESIIKEMSLSDTRWELSRTGTYYSWSAIDAMRSKLGPEIYMCGDLLSF